MCEALVIEHFGGQVRRHGELKYTGSHIPVRSVVFDKHERALIRTSIAGWVLMLRGPGVNVAGADTFVYASLTLFLIVIRYFAL